MRRILSVSAVAISTILWLPSQWKIISTKSAKDYSPWSFALILWLQASCFIIARMDKSKGLQAYYLVNGANVALMLGLILYFKS